MDEDARRRQREYMREWRARNREKDRAYQKAYYESYYASVEHREAARKRAADWYSANKEHALELARQRYDEKPKSGYPTGADHHRWKGDDVGYFALHTWVERQRGKPSKCDHCGRTDAKRFEWANVDHKYRRVIEDWLRLCTSCHRRYDYARGLAKKGGRRRKDE